MRSRKACGRSAGLCQRTSRCETSEARPSFELGIRCLCQSNHVCRQVRPPFAYGTNSSSLSVLPCDSKQLTIAPVLPAQTGGTAFRVMFSEGSHAVDDVVASLHDWKGDMPVLRDPSCLCAETPRPPHTRGMSCLCETAPARMSNRLPSHQSAQQCPPTSSLFLPHHAGGSSNTS